MTWTTDKPTVPGWYWWRVQYKNGSFIERVYRVIVYGEMLYVPDFGDVLEMEGEWAGPLEPPLEAR